MNHKEITIRSSDKYFYSEEFFNTIKDCLIKNPDVTYINFYTYNRMDTCNRKFIAKKGLFHTYEIVISVDVLKIKNKVLEVNELTNAIMKAVYKNYKHFLIFH